MTKKQHFINELASLGINETQQMTIYFQLIISSPGLHNLTGKEIARVATLMADQKRYGYEQRISEEIEEEKLDAKTEPENPKLAKWKELKEKHPDALLLFRCGDFYETYSEDATEAAKTLKIPATMRNSVKTSSFPYRALDVYLPKLIRSGHRIAICDSVD